MQGATKKVFHVEHNVGGMQGALELGLPGVRHAIVRGRIPSGRGSPELAQGGSHGQRGFDRIDGAAIVPRLFFG